MGRFLIIVFRGFLTVVARTLLAFTLLVIVTLFALGLGIEFERQNPINCTFTREGHISGGVPLRECQLQVAQHNLERANPLASELTALVIWPAMVIAIGVWFFQGLRRGQAGRFNQCQ